MPFSGKSDNNKHKSVQKQQKCTFYGRFISSAATEVCDLEVAVSCFMRCKCNKVVSKSQITLCNPMKTHLSHCFVVEASFFGL